MSTQLQFSLTISAPSRIADPGGVVQTPAGDGYPEDWPYIAWLIKCVARWRCEHCGHPDDREAGRMLTVHHLDGDKTNCNWRNLVALCQRCHLHIQARWQPGQPWLYNPPLWAARRGYAEVEGVQRLDDLTLAEKKLLEAIRDCADGTGAAHSLFNVAVRHAGIDYAWAHYRLPVLEALGLIHVERSGQGRPLVMRLV